MLNPKNITHMYVQNSIVVSLLGRSSCSSPSTKKSSMADETSWAIGLEHSFLRLRFRQLKLVLAVLRWRADVLKCYSTRYEHLLLKRWDLSRSRQSKSWSSNKDNAIYLILTYFCHGLEILTWSLQLKSYRATLTGLSVTDDKRWDEVRPSCWERPEHGAGAGIQAAARRDVDPPRDGRGEQGPLL